MWISTHYYLYLVDNCDWFTHQNRTPKHALITSFSRSLSHCRRRVCAFFVSFRLFSNCGDTRIYWANCKQKIYTKEWFFFLLVFTQNVHTHQPVIGPLMSVNAIHLFRIIIIYLYMKTYSKGYQSFYFSHDLFVLPFRRHHSKINFDNIIFGVWLPVTSIEMTIKLILVSAWFYLRLSSNALRAQHLQCIISDWNRKNSDRIICLWKCFGIFFHNCFTFSKYFVTCFSSISFIRWIVDFFFFASLTLSLLLICVSPHWAREFMICWFYQSTAFSSYQIE